MHEKIVQMKYSNKLSNVMGFIYRSKNLGTPTCMHSEFHMVWVYFLLTIFKAQRQKKKSSAVVTYNWTKQNYKTQSFKRTAQVFSLKEQCIYMKESRHKYMYPTWKFFTAINTGMGPIHKLMTILPKTKKQKSTWLAWLGLCLKGNILFFLKG